MIRINRYRADGTLYDSKKVKTRFISANFRAEILFTNGAQPAGNKYTTVIEGGCKRYHTLQYAYNEETGKDDALKGGRMEIFADEEQE
jgi:hypothetical protein